MHRRNDSAWRTRRNYRKATPDQDQMARFQAAFVEADSEAKNMVIASQLGPAFQKLGYFDVRAEEIEKLAREHSSQGGTEMNFEEFSSMMAAFEEKRKFFSSIR
eukprot:CAMPEP_0181302256 /NCGR_PEP_ID=MMETSP1101-20121128/7879_1 /TAXON_ID=46948 /ORGANISM="Rhodomonas abbreviata, Strain Caron Lab Isolate" /LENGTH=103 /DNA_ID=CAMNT_0023407653 /DNA_START=321 /DNA_END=628 /DNA_ORIENTATION=+